MPTAIFIDIEGDNGVFVKIFGVIKKPAGLIQT
jgi:hypothetical protein